MSGFLVNKSLLDPTVTQYSGGTASFTLPQSGSTNATEVFVGGVPQVAGVDFNVAGTALTLTTSAPAGSNMVCARQYFADGITGTAGANTVATSAIQNDSVTGGKLNPALVQGDLIYADGTDTINRLAKGAASQQLAMNSGATAPEWVTAAAGGWEEVTTTTASDVAAVEFTGLADGYDYRVEIIQSLPATDHKYLKALVGTGGTPTYLTSGYQATYGSIYEGGTDYGGDGGTTHVAISERQGSDASEELYGQINIYDPGSSAIHFLDAWTSAEDSSGRREVYWAQTINTGTTALTAIKFLYESGNVASGAFKLLRIGRS